ncbi:pyocin knob domain-containing protein [Brucella tritici]|uniref:Uncharacterized protein n=1 Tax=Brucella tritici TaxID=94626 RepID=A0A6L3YTQ8_9HYPH|nr:pyocin knob domain-containing protein [Brucella tritici]KAB2687513.1 hypothetical protein F9L08_08135 [Brucella tritici]
MAYQDQFYTTGTVTVTSGSPTVTGAGTGWQTALIQGGVLYVRGGAYPILTVDSETKITLAVPYTGTNGSGVIYAVDRQRSAATSAVAMNDRLAQIIASIQTAQPASGNLEALAGLTSAANKGIMFTGAGTAGTFDLTAIALTILGRPNGSAIYGDLGVVPEGQLPGRLRAIPVLVDNCNTITESGFYKLAANSTGAPETATMVLLHIAYADNAARQIAFRHSSNAFYERANVSGTWSTWYRMYSGANIVSTVSQSGGVPNGGIIQRGSNSNGHFTRYADGTQECWRNNLTATPSTSSTCDVAWTFPASFVDDDIFGSVTGRSFGGVPNNMRYGLPIFSVSSSSTASVGFGSNGEFASSGIDIRVYAKGRWF